MKAFMKRLLTFLTILALGASLFACAPNASTSASRAPEPVWSPAAGSLLTPSEAPFIWEDDGTGTDTRGTKLSLTLAGDLEIIRLDTGIVSEAPEDGMWTVFVYQCGSNLESEYGLGTKDLREMVAATKKAPNLRFVVLAGGSERWHNDYCADGGNTLLIVSGGDIEAVESTTANMGDPDTLCGFLDWGLTNYRSQYIALDFWDHGGGSLGGVCLDERYDHDRLTLVEIDTALTTIYNQYTVIFDLIGCDACLMATMELANIFVPFAEYMIASQEVEPGSGWEYTGFGLGAQAEAENGAEMGKCVCDAYFASIPGGLRHTATLSVIDLSAVDRFLRGFNSYCMDIYNYICEEDGLDEVMKAARELPSFGEGRYNLTDLSLLIQKTSEYSTKAERTLSLMEDCVAYMVNGSCYMDVGGIAIYFPVSYSVGTQHMNSLKNICVTPYYLAIIDVCAYGKETEGNTNGYKASQWLDEESEYWSENEVSDNDYNYLGDSLDGGLNFDMNYIQALFSTIPHRDDSSGYNKYTFTLSDEGMEKVDTVYTNSFQLVTIDGRERLIDLGVEFVASGAYYRNSGIRTEEQQWFSGTQAGLTDTDLLSPHPITRRYVEGYGNVNFYYTPVLYNDKLKNLVFYEYYDENAEDAVLNTPRIYAIGTTDIDDPVASRTEPIQKGDTIQPVYPAYYADTLEFEAYRYSTKKDPYVCQEDGELKMTWNAPLQNGSYKWSYLIKDIYGNLLYTPTVSIELDRANNYVAIMSD